MKKKQKKFLALILCAMLLLSGCGNNAATAVVESETTSVAAVKESEPLSFWTMGADSMKQQITDYVERVTDEKNTTDFIPVCDRIATFDMDGTILCEKPDSLELIVTEHRITTDLKDNADLNTKLEQLLAEFAMNPQPADIWTLYGEVVDGAFLGMTDDEVVEYFASYLKEAPAEHFSGLNYVDTVYLPMVELISYLQQNEFEVFLVSGSMRSALWGCVESYNEAYPDTPINLDRSHMIGSDVEQVWEKNTDETASDFGQDDKIVFGEARLSSNVGMTKVYNIAKQIGKTPVFACGNTDGDFSMLNYAKSSEYSSMALLVWHDSEKEVVYNTLDEWKEKAKDNGWELISMTDDFAQIFPK